ncbi:ankyrin repeat-containing protein [Anaeramoeba flamelloides]|uniref:Ankyrin repeat-containing protein n=1 Tax=Anaeramoeba flamelloides TaxID=1746091 RepID=A0AAV8ABC5_9EUKA|nr:ankyrin repeat-containing protein [Anaeramoeba flamelloides]
MTNKLRINLKNIKKKKNNPNNENKKLFKIKLPNNKTQTFYFEPDLISKKIIQMMAKELKISKKKVSKMILVLHSRQLEWPLEGIEEPLKLVDFQNPLNHNIYITYRNAKSQESITLKINYIENQEKKEIETQSDYICKIGQIKKDISKRLKKSIEDLSIECRFTRKRSIILKDDEYLIDVLRKNILYPGFRLCIKKINKNGIYENQTLNKDNSNEVININKTENEPIKKKNPRNRSLPKPLPRTPPKPLPRTRVKQNEISNMQKQMNNNEKPMNSNINETTIDQKDLSKKKKIVERLKKVKRGSLFFKKIDETKSKKEQNTTTNFENENIMLTEKNFHNNIQQNEKQGKNLNNTNTNETNINGMDNNDRNEQIGNNGIVRNENLKSNEMDNTQDIQNQIKNEMERITKNENNQNNQQKMNNDPNIGTTINNNNNNEKQQQISQIDTDSKIDYSFPKKYHFSREKVEFQLFNRNIMDYVVESNTKYLTNEGFFMDPQGQLEKIQKNLGILEIIKMEMEDKGSKFNKHLFKIKYVVETQISLFFDFSVPWICQNYNLKVNKTTVDNLPEIQQMVVKKKGKINNDNQSEALTLIKDLQSMKEFSNSSDKGVLDLIKQDLGVYWFNTNNDLEMSSGRSPTSTHFGFKFSSKPIKTGTIDSKKGVVSRKTPSHYSLTKNFLHYIKLEKNKPQDLEEKIKNKQIERSIPLSIIDISSGSNILSQEKEQYSFRILKKGKSLMDIYPNSALEKENWVRMISLMKSRLQIQQLIQVNAVLPKYPWSYAIIFHGRGFEPGNYSFDIRCINSMWNLKKTFQDICEFRNILNNKFPNIIFPNITKKLIKKESKIYKSNQNNQNNNNNNNKNNNDLRQSKESSSKEIIQFIDAFMKEILSDLEVSQSKTVRTFFQIDNIYNAILMEDLELMKMTFMQDKKSAMKLTDGRNNILHYVIEKNSKEEIINLILQYFPFLFKLPNGNKITPILLAIKLGKLSILEIFSKYETIDFNVINPDLNGETPFLFSAKNTQFEILQFIYENSKVDINYQQTIKSNSALHFAVLNQKTEMVNYLLENGIDTELKNELSLTPLNLAIKIQNLEIIKKLLKYNADPNSQDKFGQTSLHLCAKTCNYEILETLLNTGKININQKDYSNRTALFNAVTSNFIECINKLIEIGVEINSYDNQGLNIIHLAIQESELILIQLLEKFIKDKKQIEVSKPTKNGVYPIHTATKRGEMKLINFLLGYGIDIDVQNHEGNTALHIAIQNTNVKLVKTFLSKNADSMIVNNKNQYPLFLASFLPVKDYSKSIEICYQLLQHNSFIDSKNGEYQRVVLNQAIIKKNLNLARFLVDYGARINVPDNEGNIALHFCCQSHYNNLASYLVKRGANPYCLNKNKKTPLDFINNKNIKKKLVSNWDFFMNKKVESKFKKKKINQKVTTKIVKAHFLSDINNSNDNSTFQQSTKMIFKSSLTVEELKKFIIRKFLLTYSVDEIRLIFHDSKLNSYTILSDNCNIDMEIITNGEINAYHVSDFDKMFDFNDFLN